MRFAARIKRFYRVVQDRINCHCNPVRDEDVARLSPFSHQHINLLVRYSFDVHDAVARGELRPLRPPIENP